MRKLNKDEIIELIEKLQRAEGTDEEQSEWIYQIENSVPFHQEIINLLFWSNEKLTAEDLYKKAEKNYNPIIL
ncbi:hypothetical protein [Defluviitalea phaphyphila]|uniref:hypothetical protein n=1 Tax=Defluviitalea phaphyphila TaxID=1473580 RepID=UPI00072FC550|nr:hypothetical protein [Defluviitalea phaphyphila]